MYNTGRERLIQTRSLQSVNFSVTFSLLTENG